jgi:hypothetical protein
VKHLLKIEGAELKCYGKIASRLAIPQTGTTAKTANAFVPGDPSLRDRDHRQRVSDLKIEIDLVGPKSGAGCWTRRNR